MRVGERTHSVGLAPLFCFSRVFIVLKEGRHSSDELALVMMTT